MPAGCIFSDLNELDHYTKVVVLLGLDAIANLEAERS